MNRYLAAASVALGLLASLPSGSEAQASGGSRLSSNTHIVERGETLQSIALFHLGSAARWQEIFELNASLIGDPTRMPVGIELQLPGAEGVAGVPGAGSPDAAGAPTPAGERGQDQEQLPTVFLRPGGDAVRSRVVSREPESVPAVPVDQRVSAPWLEEVGDDGSPVHSGSLELPEEVRTRRGAPSPIVPGAELRVRVREGAASSAAPGDVLLAFRAASESRVGEYGVIALPTGLLRVLAVEPEGLTVRLERVWGVVRSGDLVRPVPVVALEPGVIPRALEDGRAFRVVAHLDPGSVLLPGAILFVDGGVGSGVAVGDHFELSAPDGGAIRLQAVGVRERSSTLRVMAGGSRTIPVGALLTRTRGMP
jgi:hypothetical protein